mmetsp:Transcript_7617/g.12461  ORF Transcript_7617/g.12461 Transcript_7617/m.12461 type:complete len:660 (-) Transcript_7617:883-2862(-)|eukprot:CAMPEP_0197027992 /NCGR_PEP_ID=MMETSP1384-20130603/7818_1 /TAXON_ID=29189 /ORGANISM="Ammonia sp." /LENGTH=659 /DNA_ID=CAMNT_0042456927 /DNA_START=55 /DNA_END=2034 /DNA_ORIENTATION=+
MPTVEIKRTLLLQRLGKKDNYSQKEFADLCFDFGIELDEVTSEYEMILHNKGGNLTEKERKNKKLREKKIPELRTADTEQLYKIDVPANRYDLLCVEGLTRALRIFEGKEKHPVYKVLDVDDEKSIMQFTVKADNCNKIRPYAVGAVLRDIDLDDDEKYDSFIKLQEKLHFNICRKRELVAIGTHDLDTLKPPFLFDARAPTSIKFKALKEEKEMNAAELFAWYKSKDYKDMNGNDICAVKEYLHLIDESPVYPIIYDSNNVVLSLPPIINGEHSKITRKTKNVFIECTATDLTKANTVLNTMVTMFSEYCKNKFVVEPVRVVYEGGSNKTFITPDFKSHRFETTAEYINKNLGTSLSDKEIINLLYKMGLQVSIEADSKPATLFIEAPPTRSDILHPVDIVEDVAIAYGYNNLIFRLPDHATTGKEFILNSISDKIREIVALCGYIEVLNWALISRKENFEYMLIDEKQKEQYMVKLTKPKATQFEICRTNLLPGMFKTLSANIGQKNMSLPLHLFEVGDVIFCDRDVNVYEVGARNEKRLAALICDTKNSGLENIHGLLDRIMQQNEVSFLPQIELKSKYNGNWPSGGKRYYSIREANKPSFFPKRQAEILVDNKAVGYFGIIHPKVLKNFNISTVTPVIVSALEINIECFVKRSRS